MYTKEHLVKYPYFEKLLQTQDISNITDSLTGLISRTYIVLFIQSLIEEGTPFTVAMLDLDNFKFINDTLGHKTGDSVLAACGNNIINFLEDFGLAGRYGGDEFIIINFRDTDYESIKRCYIDMYTNYTVLRKNIKVGEYSTFVTGTIGSATFPKDAADYESLFGLIDKTLYRGKSKGRNCYVIYVKEKHGNIQITTLARRGVSAICSDLVMRFDSTDGLHNKLHNMFELLREDMRISNLFYVGADKKLKSLDSDEAWGDAANIDKLVVNNFYTSGNIDEFKILSDDLYTYCRDNEVASILVVKISIGDEIYGYLICAEPRSKRIWQDDEEAIIFFVARMIAAHIKLTGEQI